jgi:hypothetical protein
MEYGKIKIYPSNWIQNTCDNEIHQIIVSEWQKEILNEYSGFQSIPIMFSKFEKIDIGPMRVIKD